MCCYALCWFLIFFGRHICSTASSRVAGFLLDMTIKMMDMKRVFNRKGFCARVALVLWVAMGLLHGDCNAQGGEFLGVRVDTAAKAAGLYCIGFVPPKAVPQDISADEIVTSLYDIINL